MSYNVIVPVITMCHQRLDCICFKTIVFCISCVLSGHLVLYLFIVNAVLFLVQFITRAAEQNKLLIY